METEKVSMDLISYNIPIDRVHHSSKQQEYLSTQHFLLCFREIIPKPTIFSTLWKHISTCLLRDCGVVDGSPYVLRIVIELAYSIDLPTLLFFSFSALSVSFLYR